jgi:hypothetical protein
MVRKLFAFEIQFADFVFGATERLVRFYFTLQNMVGLLPAFFYRDGGCGIQFFDFNDVVTIRNFECALIIDAVDDGFGFIGNVGRADIAFYFVGQAFNIDICFFAISDF